MQTLNQLPRIASIVAFVIAGIYVLAGSLGPIVILPFAIVPVCAGVGILRKRVWSAYGFATFSFAQLLLIPIVLFRPRFFTGHPSLMIANGMCSLLLGILFRESGRANRLRSQPNTPQGLVVQALKVPRRRSAATNHLSSSHFSQNARCE